MSRALEDYHRSSVPRHSCYSIQGKLRLPGTYTAKIDENQTPLDVSLNNSVTRPYLKNLRGVFLTKWLTMSKLCLHFQGDL